MNKIVNDYNNILQGQYKTMNLPLCLSFVNQNSKSQIPEDLLTRLNQAKMRGSLKEVESLFQQLNQRDEHMKSFVNNIQTLLSTDKKLDDELRNANKSNNRLPHDQAAKS